MKNNLNKGFKKLEEVTYKKIVEAGQKKIMN